MLKENGNSASSRASATTHKKRGLKSLIVFLVFTVLIGACAWLFINYNNAQKQVNYLSGLTAEDMNKKTTDELLEKIGKLILLPEDEQMTISTIQDIEKLVAEEPFFEKAQNGDKVIIYNDRAIIYSPTKNILVNVGPVYTQENNNQGENENLKINEVNTMPVEEIITLEIRNGSEIAGLATELNDKLSDRENYKIISVGNAARKDYDNNMLINLSGKDINKLEEYLGAQAVNFLPTGEAQSAADAVIILGNEE